MENYVSVNKRERYTNCMQRRPRLAGCISLTWCILLYYFINNHTLMNTSNINQAIVLEGNLSTEIFLEIINKFGKAPTKLPETFEKLLQEIFDNGLRNDNKNLKNSTETKILFKQLRPMYMDINAARSNNKERHTVAFNSGYNSIGGIHKRKTSITIATIACGNRHDQVILMLKSMALFSQDAALHVIVFSDSEAITNVGIKVLNLKWTANSLGWDFTFEMHLEWFPTSDGQGSSINWKDMYAKCATQRLFFPSLLPHIDSLIYMDSDTIALTNMTELWLEIPGKMGESKMAAASANTEGDCWSVYSAGGHVPYYGEKGINAGVMLMNLTQMRHFKFQEKSIGAQALYEQKLELADQDIINIIFSIFPDKMVLLDCSYNINWIHCGADDFNCYNETTGENFCFCRTTKQNGVKILHGNSGTFSCEDKDLQFMVQAYKGFTKFDLLIDSPTILIESLKTAFKNLPHQPCPPLTPHLLYGNAEKYINNLKAV